MAKRLLQRSEFLRQNKYNSHSRIYEAIATNDIPWGDSIIGRMLSSLARKAKIAYNTTRIDRLVKSLRQNFDQLLELGQAGISNDDVKLLTIWSLISELMQLVNEKKGSLFDILSVTRNLRNEVSTSDLEDRDELLKIIDEFIKFLEEFDPEEEDEDKPDPDDNDVNIVKPDSNEGVKIYPLMIKNLKSLSLVLSQYQTKGGQRGVVQDEKTVEKFYYTTKGSETIEGISKLPENKFKWTPEKIWTTNATMLKIYEDKFKKNPKSFGGNKYKMQLSKGLKLYLGKGAESKGSLKEITESFIFEDNAKPGQLGTGGSKERGEIKTKEDHLSQAFSKLKKGLEALVDSKTKGVGIDAKFINEITAKSLDSKNKELIFELYFEIQRYLAGDKKATMPVRDKLYESIEVISDKRKKVIVAEKIARFATRALQFDGEGLYGGLGDIGKPLEDFVTSMKQIIKLDLKSKEKSEKENESIFKSYDNFVKLILEKAVDYDEIKVKFDELFTDEVISKLCPDKDKIEEFKKTGTLPGGTYTIRTTDPIISIIRLFQRAYRLHTPGQIPSGRSEGRVSVSVFNEYEYMGTGSPGDASRPGGGPYRNISLFDKWQAGVDTILADAKYRPLFSDNTVFEFQGPKGPGDKVKKGGKMLLRFINKLLDDNEMYRGSGSGDGGGALYKVYEEYFGLSLNQKDIAPDPASKKDLQINSGVATGVKITECDWFDIRAVGLNNENLSKLFTTPDYTDYKDICIKFTVKRDDGVKTYYAVVDDFLTNKEPKLAMMCFSSKGFAFDVSKVKMPGGNQQPDTVDKVYYGYISGDFEKGKNCKINYVILDNARNVNEKVNQLGEDKGYPITEIKILGTKEDKQPFKELTKLSGKFAALEKNKATARTTLKNHRK
jgi:hypothetical protein